CGIFARHGRPRPPRRARLAAAARALVGGHDFAAFALAGGAARTTERRIFAAAWEEEGDELVFRVVGEGFLRGMVRGLVGTMLEVGTGRRSLGQFVRLLSGGARGEAGATAPAHGLCLERVELA
ncbi:MAG TPA: tRNA pseudouridine(38-40) synthase TruA, partial [Thermoanaerobaculia bacterium]|nr:tRNA pseudouridine(38-40) synthase TruA [Thermoanaerobaculia bacterium]